MNEFGDMGELEFKHNFPKNIGVYVVVKSKEYDDFMNNPSVFHLDGLKEVFVKKAFDGAFYAAGEDFRLAEDEFDDYVWARRCDYN